MHIIMPRIIEPETGVVSWQDAGQIVMRTSVPPSASMHNPAFTM